ncbi:MAG TPA: histidine kinase [Cyclobacteriaceae bacterium]|nr:histidine kinase [Cyclobacteriaceae bacterium]
MKRIFIHNPFFRILAAPVYGVLVYLIILLFANNVEQLGSLFSNQELYVCIALAFISFESMRLTIVGLRYVHLPFKNKAVPQIVITTVISVAMVLLAISQYYKLVIGFDISAREMMRFGVIFTLTSFLYNALYIGNQYLLQENTLRIEQEQKLRESLESEFMSFRQEINPDLLYDSLEELILCLHRNSDVSEELIDSLAALYRYQLIHRQREFVSLAEEVQAVQHLLRLANQKHHHNIRWNNSIQHADNIQLMPGALITAVDSIVRNTLISSDAPLVFNLAQEDDDYFVLHHDLNDKLQLHPESLQAFQRLQRSYSVYSDRPFIQVKAGRENYVKFPLITVDQSINEVA